jgi:four helix bundle protein
MNKIVRVEDLTVWQKAHNVVLDVYRVTKDFPVDEKYALVSQMKRAAVSVPANISEGFKKNSKKDKINYYNIAQGSLNELGYYIKLSNDLGFLKDFKRIYDNVDEVGRMLAGLIKSIQSSC